MMGVFAVPARWGHTVVNLTPTVGIAVGFRTHDTETAKLVMETPVPRTCSGGNEGNGRDMSGPGHCDS